MPSNNRQFLNMLWTKPENILAICAMVIIGPMNYFFSAQYPGFTASFTTNLIIGLSIACCVQIYEKYKELINSQYILSRLEVPPPRMPLEQEQISLVLTTAGPILTVATLLGYDIGLYHAMSTTTSTSLALISVAILPICKNLLDRLLQVPIDACQRSISEANLDIIDSFTDEDLSKLPPNLRHPLFLTIHARNVLEQGRAALTDVDTSLNRTVQVALHPHTARTQPNAP